jgi:spore coat protein CotH
MRKLLLLLFLRAFTSLAQNPGDSTFNATYIHDINITMTETNWWDSLMYYKMHADSFGLSTQSMVANITIDGTLIDSIGVSLKGNSSFGYPGLKKPIKLSFNEYISSQKFDGLKTLNLNNNTLDPTYMREKLMLDFMNARGLPAPRCSYARVSYNGAYVGLYKIIEQIDKTFLQTHFGNKSGNLFKGDPQGTLLWFDNNPSTYYPWYELHTNTTVNDWSDLVNLIDNINNTPAADFHDTLERYMNTTPLIRQWAARNLFVDLDAYYHAPHNYYLYDNPATGKFEWCTWDVSVSFGFYPYWSEDSTENISVLMAGNILASRMLADPAYKTAYLNSICEYLDYFSNSILDPQIDSIGNAIRTSVYAEPDTNQMFPEVLFEGGMDTLTFSSPIGDIPALKKFITRRRANVIAELASMPFTCTNGQNELTKNSPNIEVWPNPFSESTMIQVRDIHLNTPELKISDLTGKEVKATIRRNNDSFIVERGTLRSGMYFYRLTDNQQIVACGKLIID